MKLAGVVVLYNPEDIVYKNILSYQEQLNVLFVVDNSEQKLEKLVSKLQRLDNVVYLNNEGNKGIAFALNRAAKGALRLKMDWLLMMDQDSSITDITLQSMKDYITRNQDDMVGIVAANFILFNNKQNERNRPYTYEEQVITSGSILNLFTYQACGDFENKLFIDQVDYEYCLRIRKHGFKIVKINNALFNHSPGNPVMKKDLIIYNYSPVRYYYIVRNSLYVSNLYKMEFPELCREKRRAIRLWIKRIFYEPRTLTKYIYMLRGYFDYRRNRFGKYN